MNRSLYEYCVGTKTNPSSETGKAIQKLISSALRSENPDDGALLRSLAAVLADCPAFDDDVFLILRPLHGCGGSEGYVLDVAPTVEAAFWKSLADRFSCNQGLSYIAADAVLLAGDQETARQFFMQGFRLDTNTFPSAPVDWEELLRGTEFHFEYRLHLLAQARLDDPETMTELISELTSEYCDEPERLKAINDVARGGGVPRPV